MHKLVMYNCVKDPDPGPGGKMDPDQNPCPCTRGYLVKSLPDTDFNWQNYMNPTDPDPHPCPK